jgi:hypothetical protein
MRVNPVITINPEPYWTYLFLLFVCLAPILSNRAIRKQNSGRLNTVALVLSGLNILFGFYFIVTGSALITFFTYILPASFSILALLSIKYNQNFFIDLRLFLVSFFR